MRQILFGKQHRIQTASGFTDAHRTYAHRYTLGATLAFIVAGIVADRYLNPSVLVWEWMVGLSSLLGIILLLPILWQFSSRLFFYFLFSSKRIRHHHRRIGIQSAPEHQAKKRLQFIHSASIALAWFSVAGYRHHVDWQMIESNHLVRYASTEAQPVIVQGRLISSTREIESGHQRFGPHEEPRCGFEIRVEAIKLGRGWTVASGRCLVVAPTPTFELRRGTRLRIYGQLNRLSPPRNPGEPHYSNLLRRRRILTRIYASSCELATKKQLAGKSDDFSSATSVSVPSHSYLESTRERIRAHVEQIINRRVSDSNRSVAKALLLGDTSQVSAEQKSLYMRTGTIHVLAVSGLHIGFVVAPFYFISRFGWCRRELPFVLGLGFSLFFAWLTGFRPPVVRATILIGVLWAGKLTGKRQTDWHGLLLAANLVLLAKPTALFGAGTYLSFIAVATLIDQQDRIASPQDMFANLETRPDTKSDLPSNNSIRLLKIASFRACQILKMAFLLWMTSLPLIASQFHLVTPTAVPTNILIMPLIALAMLTGLSLIVVESLCLPFTFLVAAPFNLALQMFHGIVGIADEVPGGSFTTCGPPTWWLFPCYGLLLAVAISRTDRPRRTRFKKLLLIWCLILTCSQSPEFMRRLGLLKRAHTDVIFVDVGHGTAAIVQLPNGMNFLYDAGSMTGDETAFERIQSVLWSRRIAHLDGVLLSHADSDHFNAIAQISQHFSIGWVYVEPTMLGSKAGRWDDFRKGLIARGIRISPLYAGLELAGESDCMVRVCHPPPLLANSSDNDRSLAILIQHGNSSLLLTGDLESQGNQRLMRALNQEVTILMAPHHGSPFVPIHDMTKQYRPKAIAVSGARNSKSISIMQRYQAIGSEVFTTYQDGAILIRLSKNTVHLDGWSSKKTFRSPSSFGETEPRQSESIAEETRNGGPTTR